MKQSNNRLYKVWALITSALLLLVFFVAAAPVLNAPTAVVPLGYSTNTAENISVSFQIPKGWHKSDKVRITITATSSTTEIAKIEAKTTQNGSWSNITDTLYLDISENGTVYVQVTDKQGVVTARSQYIECFDREPPEVRASRSGQLLRIEATDRQSGVDCVYLDGERYSDLSDGTVEIRLDKKNTEEEKLLIQAVDHAGNLSATYSMKNPYYKDSASSQSSQSSGQSAQTTSSSQPSSNTTASTTPAPPANTTAVQPPASANTTTSKPEATATGTATDPEAENKGAPGVVQVDDKQFITIETKDEKIFYLIIDGEGSVYLVTEATTTDLQSFTKDEAQTDESGNPVSGTNGTPDPNADKDTLIDGGSLPESSEVDLIDEGSPGGDTGKDTSGNSSGSPDKTNSRDITDTDDTGAETAKNGNPIPGWVVIVLMVFVLSVAAYLFFVVLPRKKAKEAYIEDDDDEEFISETYPHEQEEMEHEEVEEHYPENPDEPDTSQNETNGDTEDELHQPPENDSPWEE